MLQHSARSDSQRFDSKRMLSGARLCDDGSIRKVIWSGGDQLIPDYWRVGNDMTMCMNCTSEEWLQRRKCRRSKAQRDAFKRVQMSRLLHTHRTPHKKRAA